MEVIFFIAAFFSEIVGTVAGFGSSTVFLHLALLFFDFKTALLLVALLHIFGIPSVLLTLIGALLVSNIPQEILKGILGIFLIAYASISFWNEDLKVKPSLLNSILGGGLSGFLAGLIGTGGTLRGAFLTAFNLPKEKYI